MHILPDFNTLPDNTAAACATLCARNGLGIAYIECGGECARGHAFAHTPVLHPTSECNMKFAGNADLTCGTGWCTQLFTKNALVPATATIDEMPSSSSTNTSTLMSAGTSTSTPNSTSIGTSTSTSTLTPTAATTSATSTDDAEGYRRHRGAIHRLAAEPSDRVAESQPPGLAVDETPSPDVHTDSESAAGTGIPKPPGYIVEQFPTPLTTMLNVEPQALLFEIRRREQRARDKRCMHHSQTLQKFAHWIAKSGLIHDKSDKLLDACKVEGMSGRNGSSGIRVIGDIENAREQLLVKKLEL
ncbi:hypothetical protein AURDEDRAFT_156687 [Auricularia subglabra TFB-10046 SS5]|nr:hypothetical protein AURDEDRAFT_156687 [Auricularia subglabra TFB-10046 SS5]